MASDDPIVNPRPVRPAEEKGFGIDEVARADLVVRDVYEIRSRNLLAGVFVGQDENDRWPRFIGIRQKFGYRYLFEEYGWEPFRRIGRVPLHADLNVSSSTLRRSLAQYERRASRT